MAKEPQDMVPSRRGRPKVEAPRTTLSARVELKRYDQLVRLANKRDQSLSSLVNDLLKLRFP